MKCENCKNEHNGKYGSGRFCSVKCAEEILTWPKWKQNLVGIESNYTITQIDIDKIIKST